MLPNMLYALRRPFLARNIATPLPNSSSDIGSGTGGGGGPGVRAKLELQGVTRPRLPPVSVKAMIKAPIGWPVGIAIAPSEVQFPRATSETLKLRGLIPSPSPDS